MEVSGIKDFFSNAYAKITGDISVIDGYKAYQDGVQQMVNTLKVYKGGNPSTDALLKKSYNDLRALALSLRNKFGGHDELLEALKNDFNKRMKTNYDAYTVYGLIFEAPIRTIGQELVNRGIAKGDVFGQGYPSELSDLGVLPAVAIVGLAKIVVAGGLALGTAYLAYKAVSSLDPEGKAAYEQTLNNREALRQIEEQTKLLNQGKITKEEYQASVNAIKEANKAPSIGISPTKIIIIGAGLALGYLFLKKKGIIK